MPPSARKETGGLVTLVSVRSGPETVVLVVESFKLVLSFVSGFTCLTAAPTTGIYALSLHDALPISVTVPLEVALEASEGTARLPVSRRAPLFVVVVER